MLHNIKYNKIYRPAILPEPCMLQRQNKNQQPAAITYESEVDFKNVNLTNAEIYRSNSNTDSFIMACTEICRVIKITNVYSLLF